MYLGKLIDGYKDFYKLFFEDTGKEARLMKRLVQEGQHPESMVIACSDSRVDPAIVTNAALGDIFVFRNIASIVPEYDSNAKDVNGVIAATEYAVKALKVKNIIIMAHSHCGGCHALDEFDATKDGFDCIHKWVAHALPSLEIVKKKEGLQTQDEHMKDIEQEVGKLSLKNLNNIPWVKEAVRNGLLATHLWYFDIETGKISEYSEEDGGFSSIT